MTIPCRAIDVAGYFILKGVKEERLITNMKLQKLLYYAQGWWLALHNNQPLFKEDFKKWMFGPVCQQVYDVYKKYGSSPIPIPEAGTSEIENPEIAGFLDFIWNAYSKYTAIQLSELSHKEAPWLYAAEFEIITKQSLYDFFSSIKNKLNPQPAL